jgi:hypothetical protein
MLAQTTVEQPEYWKKGSQEGGKGAAETSECRLPRTAT